MTDVVLAKNTNAFYNGTGTDERCSDSIHASCTGP